MPDIIGSTNLEFSNPLISTSNSTTSCAIPDDINAKEPVSKPFFRTITLVMAENAANAAVNIGAKSCASVPILCMDSIIGSNATLLNPSTHA